MNRYLERLPGRYFGLRISALLVCLLTVAFICQWLLVQPQRHLRLELISQCQQAAQQTAALQKSIATLPGIDPLPAAAPAKPFSAMEAVRQSGGRLVKWQPGIKHSLLEILLPWRKVPALFQQLAGYQRLRLPAFELGAAGERVRVVLTLEYIDESS
ncbi:hypothetical protein [Cedecea davisae]|uniref:HofO family protein n=1 Tax=Cedecea davisae TaxID=158484 RepID=UPI0024318C55|nr:hypothetical protein [Cedecea davisae]